MNYIPRSSSLADRICTWFHRPGNRGEERTPTELAKQFDTARNTVVAELEEAVTAEWLIYTQGEKHMVYKAGPRLGQTAAPLASAATQASKPSSRRPPATLPPLNTAAIPVRDNVPLPEARRGVLTRRYEPLLDKLAKPGQSLLVPIEYRTGLNSAAKAYGKRTGRQYSLRVIDPQHIGIWRTA